jgi:hypothetical protein
MTQLAIQLECPRDRESCCLCDRLLAPASGPELCLAGSQLPVCQACGKEHAPALAALLDMARVADRVGRIGRHTVLPPLSALMDLARVAENFAETNS